MTVLHAPVHKGDEVLIRARVVEPPAWNGEDANIKVELFSKTDQYRALVRRDLVEQVIPQEQTKTHRGYSVADTKRAVKRFTVRILEVTQEIEARGLRGHLELELAGLQLAKADLIQSLRDINVEPDKESA
jgi:hypothetical protein